MTEEYYVYAYLREDGTPYYIGKGKGSRAYSKHKGFKPPAKDRILIILRNLTEEQAFSNEIDFIAWYGRKDNGTGILRNLTDGGEGASGFVFPESSKQILSARNKGKKISDKVKKKMSEAHKKRFIENPELRKIQSDRNKRLGITIPAKTPEQWEIWKKNVRETRAGYTHSEETRNKISKAAIGRKKSSEAIEKQRQKMIGKVPWNKGKTGLQVAWNKGKTHSEETKQKISASAKARKGGVKWGEVVNQGFPE